MDGKVGDEIERLTGILGNPTGEEELLNESDSTLLEALLSQDPGQLRDRLTRQTAERLVVTLFTRTPSGGGGGNARHAAVQWLSESPRLWSGVAAEVTPERRRTWPLLGVLMESLKASVSSGGRGAAAQLAGLLAGFSRHHERAAQLEGLRCIAGGCENLPEDCREMLFDLALSSLSVNESELVPASFAAVASLLPLVDPCACGAPAVATLKALTQGLTRTQGVSLRRLYLQGATRLVDGQLRLSAVRSLKQLLLAGLEYLRWHDGPLVRDALRFLLALVRHCWVRIPSHAPGVFFAASLLVEQSLSEQPLPMEPSTRALLALLLRGLRAAVGGEEPFSRLLGAVNGQVQEQIILMMGESSRGNLEVLEEPE